MTTAFTVTRKLRPADCGPADIAFYPRLIEHVNGVVEGWFDGSLDHSFKVLHSMMQRGFPTVAVNMNFPRPAEPGDVIKWRLAVKSQNHSSLTLSVRARRANGEDLMLAEPTLVHTNFERYPPKSEPFPDELRRSRELPRSQMKGAAANRCN